TVELAGATDPDRVRRFLQSTANLQFFEVYTLNDQVIITALQNADRALEAALYSQPKSSDSAATNDSTALTDSARLASQANPLFQVLIPSQPYQDQTGRQVFGSAIGRTLIRDTAKV